MFLGIATHKCKTKVMLRYGIEIKHLRKKGKEIIEGLGKGL
tara:strand:- start:578 stop:700 length:123 start_codon:yes stop_codon:yes gene_type:complete